jgi:hypothetical protein
MFDKVSPRGTDDKETETQRDKADAKEGRKCGDGHVWEGNAVIQHSATTATTPDNDINAISRLHLTRETLIHQSLDGKQKSEVV